MSSQRRCFEFLLLVAACGVMYGFFLMTCAWDNSCGAIFMEVEDVGFFEN
jgi:hypothetical protein